VSNHYYSNRPDVESRPRTIHFRARGISLEMTTDAGVFSKQGLDFGTRLLIETIEMEDDATCVDLGCGYGPVTAVLGRVYAQSKWILLDVNERAVELASANVKSLGSRVEAYVSDGFSAVPELVVDAVAFNPPIRAGKAVIYRLFQEAKDHLREGGALWVVIHKKHGAPSAKKYLETLFSDVQLKARDAGYHVFCCVK
jgi:16S rRNA (guanine1207-N2)-methyltransferase